jgi:hypothetical protein
MKEKERLSTHYKLNFCFGKIYGSLIVLIVSNELSDRKQSHKNILGERERITVWTEHRTKEL